MKLINICNSCAAAMKINKLNLPFSKARKVLELFEKMQEETKFYIQEEEKLVNKYISDGSATRQGAKVSFTSADAKKQYVSDINALENTEIEFAFPIIYITELEIGDQRISGQDIDLLKDFIKFGDE